MNAETKKIAPSVEDALNELKPQLFKLREKFPPHAISKLPKPTKAQTDAVKVDFKKGVRCKECGAWHHPDVVHLDYVGHAALTDRLLDVDPEWSWEPVAFRDGLPAFDATGGLWIKLTVCGVTRLGYGHAAAKPNQDPGAREKEVIGDALRNAAMRFGAALDLWHKGDLHAEEDDSDKATPRADPVPHLSGAKVASIQSLAQDAKVSIQTICEAANVSELTDLSEEKAASIIKKLNVTIEKAKAAQVADILDDEIPY